MRIPICAFDAKTGILCPKCENKVKTGHLTQADVDSSIALVRLAEHSIELKKATLLRAHNVGGQLVLAVGAGDLSIFRGRDDLMKMLENEFGTKVWIVEGNTSDRRFLEDVFYPVRVLTVNTVWLPGGMKLTKAIISGRKTERFPIDIQIVKDLAKTVRGFDLLVEFERT